MYRFAEEDLKSWSQQDELKPLLLRGARQVGKSYLVEKFGREHFSNLVTVNFEFNSKFKTCFNTLDPVRITNLISGMTGEPIMPGKTLLFLDEIQECPEAILAMRYFKEKMPNLHLIGAGSLLKFTLNQPKFRMPVGRVQSFYLYPCSFYEYLIATGHQVLYEYLKQITVRSGVENAFHEVLLEKLREYFVLGGMPEVVRNYAKHKNTHQCHTIQASLVEFYRKDFGKYDKKIKLDYLKTLFDKIPRMIAQRFKYSDVNPDVLSRDLKPALRGLIDAGLVYPAYHTSASGLPLQSTINERIFKLFFVDIGLVSYMSELDIHTLMHEHLITLNRGAMAEQFVCQELQAHGRVYEKKSTYYWQREKPGSSAEVDFVINIGSTIYPIEVKAGKTGRLKSLQVFLDEKQLKFGLRISQQQLAFQDRILSIPLYLVSEIPRLIEGI